MERRYQLKHIFRVSVGKIHYEDPEHPGDMLSAYGVIGETIVGKLLLGEALGIYNDGGSLKFDKNGLSISNGTNSFVVNPNDETLISLSNNNGKILWVEHQRGASFTWGWFWLGYNLKRGNFRRF